jgi:hypothetical protein
VRRVLALGLVYKRQAECAAPGQEGSNRRDRFAHNGVPILGECSQDRPYHAWHCLWPTVCDIVN